MLSLTMGKMSKAIGVFKKPFWHEKGLCALVLSPGETFNSVCDISPHDYSVPMIQGFINYEKRDAFMKKSPKERRDHFLQYLAKYLGP